MAESNKFKLRVIGRFPAHLASDETGESALGLDAVSALVLAGPDWEHLSMCGTLTMTESEWTTLVEALRAAISDGVVVDDLTSEPSG